MRKALSAILSFLFLTGGTINAGETVYFYLDKGSVALGDIYSGYDQNGTEKTGTHASDNKYIITQTDPDTANTNSIDFSGNDLTFDVTINGINTTKNPSIYIPAYVNNVKHVSLNFTGNNTLMKLEYSTSTGSHGNQPNADGSTLLITSNSLQNTLTIGSESLDYAEAALGGTDLSENATGLIIRGGTLNVTAAGVAIGAGGNGKADITIKDGDITATTTTQATAPAIGGGLGRSVMGGAGVVTITGGTVHATHKGGYVAIGGGGSEQAEGSTGTVIIDGGEVTAVGSIGGGTTLSANSSHNGGDGVVTISGGNVTATSVGGGRANAGTGGSATVTMNGGTLVTDSIGGGYSTSKGYNRTGTVTFNGGEWDVKMTGTYYNVILTELETYYKIYTNEDKTTRYTGAASVKSGEDYTFWIVPETGITVQAFVGNTEITPNGQKYELSNITADTEVQIITFTKIAIGTVSTSVKNGKTVASALVSVSPISFSTGTDTVVIGIQLRDNNGDPLFFPISSFSASTGTVIQRRDQVFINLGTTTNSRSCTVQFTGIKTGSYKIVATLYLVPSEAVKSPANGNKSKATSTFSIE